MRKFLVYTAAGILMLAAVSCGYKMQKTYDDSALIFVEKVENRTAESGVLPVLREEVREFFIKRGLSADKNSAAFLVEAKMTDYDASADINSTSGEAVTATLMIKLNLVVLDKKTGSKVDGSYTAFEDFVIGRSLSTNKTNRNKALRLAIENALTDFRNGFESKN